MESGKHKKRINYTIMIISDSPDGGTHPFYLKQRLITTVLSLAAAILALSIGAALFFWVSLKRVKPQEEEMQQQIAQLTEDNIQLEKDNMELSEKVTILSDTVTKNAETQKEQEKEEEEKRIPRGFPLAGRATILQSSETEAAVTADTENGEQAAEGEDAQAPQEPIVVFSAPAGTKVIATASGTVVSVEDDAVYGHKVTVDHGNGYTSIYRAASDPIASEGDEVESGTELYEMQIPDEMLGYQITQDGTLIDPLDLLEVYG